MANEVVISAAAVGIVTPYLGDVDYSKRSGAVVVSRNKLHIPWCAVPGDGIAYGENCVGAHERASTVRAAVPRLDEADSNLTIRALGAVWDRILCKIRPDTTGLLGKGQDTVC